MATLGWVKEQSLNKLENILTNQEALDKQISKYLSKVKKIFSEKKGDGRIQAAARMRNQGNSSKSTRIAEKTTR